MLAFRPSRLELLDNLSRWQALRALAYLRALSAGAADAELVRDLSQLPGQDTATDPDLPVLLGRLERHASVVPVDVLDAVVRDCDMLLRGSRHAGFSIGTELTEDSRPTGPEEAIARAAALATYWYECPELRGGLTLVWSANQFVRRWLWWSRKYPEGGFPPGAPGIATSPAPPVPAPATLPTWAAALLERLEQ
ncbi:hypothetical protein [Streptomyces milbemycinicus]|uniref:hypothetical protein n=1 Tax=Streptomyces milbemycinicus TaxID=476552 RepID=UPI0033E11015